MKAIQNKLCSETGKRRLVRRLAPLCAAALVFASLALSALPAHADDYIPGTTIYIVDASGLTDVTATYNATDHTVFYNGAFIEVVLDYQGGHVVDFADNLVGFVG